jgi:hypothetical protein
VSQQRSSCTEARCIGACCHVEEGGDERGRSVVGGHGSDGGSERCVSSRSPTYWPASPEASQARPYLAMKTHRMATGTAAAVALFSMLSTAVVAPGLVHSLRRRLCCCRPTRRWAWIRTISTSSSPRETAPSSTICARMIAAKITVMTATATNTGANGTISGTATIVRRVSSSSPGSGTLTNNLRLFGRREACCGDLRWTPAWQNDA